MGSSEATAFDGIAQDYDAEFTATALGSVLRDMVWRRYDARFAGCESLLEIGCGTGEDAIYLARRGHRVLASDASTQMVRIAEAKAERAGVAHRIRFLCAPMGWLGPAIAGESFDGFYSNFGAINCEPRLEESIGTIAPHLAPGAPLVWVVMGRYVPWEWAWFIAHGHARKAFRRLSRDGVSWRGLTIHYPAPATLRRILQPYFDPTGARALGFALPPSFAGAWLDHSPRALAALTRLEQLAQGWSACATLADHYILEAQRKP
ncbi:MAG TPA: class I SAM-dependent methyltransferase [Steroidobacteraceae bacterium]